VVDALLGKIPFLVITIVTTTGLEDRRSSKGPKACEHYLGLAAESKPTSKL